MPRLFTVRWPLFARLQAVLLFAVSVLLAHEIAHGQNTVDEGIVCGVDHHWCQIAHLQNYIDDSLIPMVSPYFASLGIPQSAIAWVAAAIMVVVPYFVVLHVADRFFTIRKGYAFLSLAVIAIWGGTAMHLSGQLASLLSQSLLDQLTWRPFDQEAALAAGGLAFLLHLWPLCAGLTDQGQIADRLIYARNRAAYERSGGQRQHLQDVYYRQTADFRGWQRPDQYDGLAVGPKENSAVKVISALTWIGVISAGAFAWHHWDDFAAVKHDPLPDTRPATQVAHRTVPPGTQAAANGMPLAPVSMPSAPAGMPLVSAIPAAHDVHPIPTASALPAVQRPGESLSGSQGPNVYTGPNEAVAERGPDGSFAFDAVVNGSHVTMMFDTGATTVAIRGEDAERLGINMARLRFSAKVKTANGIADVAPVTIDTLSIGSITQRHISGFVAKPGMLQENLLGQTFLTRLARYNVEDNRLVLTGK
jgi:clan AA aspartic protease (TIGR02281 family)